MKRNEQQIDQIAGIISQWEWDTEQEKRLLARKINDTRGWTYDVRWADVTYPSDDNWTHVEGDYLSDKDLETAIDKAIDLAQRH